MPRNGSGTYTLPQAAFVPSTTISSASVNSDFSDIATALTGSVAANGETSITGPMRFASGTAPLPSITFTSESTTGFYFVSTGKIGVTGAGTAIAFFDKNRVGTGQDGNQFTYANTAIPSPVGMVSDFAGTTAPAGWLLLQGGNFTRASYPELFTVIGVTYGAGDGLTTAGLPDARGRFIAGRDDMGGSAAGRITTAVSSIDGTTVGASGGSQSITLAITNIPTITPAGSVTAVSGSGSTSGGAISWSGSVHVSTFNSGVVGSGAPLASNSGGADVGPDIAIGGSGTYAAGTCSITGGSGTFSGTPFGSTTPKASLPPTIIMNKIIFAGRP